MFSPYRVAGIACCCAAVALLLPPMTPALEAFQRHCLVEADAESMLLEQDQDAPASHFSRVSHLDPTIRQPQQSLEQFAESPAGMPPPRPRGPFKNAFFAATWLKANDVGFTDFEFTSQFGWFEVQGHSLLTLTPGLAAHFVSAPEADLPAQLYDISLDAKGLIPFSETWAMEVGLTPGFFSDFEDGFGDAFRLGARVVAYYTISPTMRLAFGVSYLDRFDVEAIPVGGLIWTPEPDTQLQLTFPRAKLARRTHAYAHAEHWWYMAADFNGGSWAIERASGAEDVVGYRDLRLILGWERRAPGGATAGLEFGLVFARDLEYESGQELELRETVMLRGTVAF